MSNVVDLDSRRASAVEQMICQKCGYVWLAVFPVGAEVQALECSLCHAQDSLPASDPSFDVKSKQISGGQWRLTLNESGGGILTLAGASVSTSFQLERTEAQRFARMLKHSHAVADALPESLL